MISVCTVIKDGIDDFLNPYIESLLAKTKQVREVFLGKATGDPASLRRWEQNGVKFTEFGCGDETVMSVGPNVQHALCLHKCLERTTQEYVMFCDPDVFFYSAVDEFYLNTMQKHNLQCIGVSHHSAPLMPYTFFPCLINLMVRKADLPGQDFLKGKLKAMSKHGLIDADGKYLMFGDYPGYHEMFPNPTGNYDTGSYLWLWGHQQKWNWASFQTPDCHVYSTAYNRSNVTLPKMPKQKLVYHAVSGVCRPEGSIKGWQEAYQATKEEDD